MLSNTIKRGAFNKLKLLISFPKINFLFKIKFAFTKLILSSAIHYTELSFMAAVYNERNTSMAIG